MPQSLLTFLVIVLLILAVLGLPHWRYTPVTWGYYPSGGLGLVVLILIILLLVG